MLDSVSGVVVALVDALEASGETYAFGGAVALAAWSEPRATADVDVVIWVEPPDVGRAVDLMEKAGVSVERESALAEAAQRGMFVGRAGNVRVDVFVPSIPFYEEAMRRRVRTRVAGRETWVHSAETLAVFKMLFFRPKDILDVERMLQVRGAGFDRGFVRGALVEMLDTDERIDKWDGSARASVREARHAALTKHLTFRRSDRGAFGAPHHRSRPWRRRNGAGLDAWAGAAVGWPARMTTMGEPVGDLVVRGRRVVTPHGVRAASVRVRGERIGGVDAFDAPVPEGARVIDAGEHVLLPGLVDTHVHVNEPGRTEWEGYRTATRAAAAGGITTVVDMPLNSIPATTSLRALDVKREAMADQCFVDVALWGGVVPGNVGELAPMFEAGVAGFKCFLVPSGVDEFPHVTEADLREALPVLASLRAPLIVHAEAQAPIDLAIARIANAHGDPRAYATWLASRPPESELDAIRLLVRLCRETGARIHVVHLACGDAVPLLAEARAEGLPMSAETCPHYLCLAAEEIAEGATSFKCAPPIREARHRDMLWQGLRDGVIDMIVSDHSPCTPALKRPEQGDFVGAWGGIASLQTLPARRLDRGPRPRHRHRALRAMDGGRARRPRRPRRSQGRHRRRTRRGPHALRSRRVLRRPRGGPRPPPSRHALRRPRPARARRRHLAAWPAGARGRTPFGRPTLRPHASTEPTAMTFDFTALLDLVAARTGGAVLAANDEFFAPKECLIEQAAPVFIPDRYTERGKWMDGWETRRRREPGFDWCILRLGAPGLIRGFVVDTTHFKGNHPEACSIEACAVEGQPSPEVLLSDTTEWIEVLPRRKLAGDSENRFAVESAYRFTHVRLNIFPDGGVARLRVYGEPLPAWGRVGADAGLVDVAAALHGGRVVACTDMFFGPRHNLIMPGAARNMGEGWETRRRRGPGNDACIVRLAATASVRRIEVDTSHFKGNAPAACSIEGCSAPGEEVPSEDVAWETVLPRNPLLPHTLHLFVDEIVSHPRVTHLRLQIYPDGGVARLRIYSAIDAEERRQHGVRWLDALPPSSCGPACSIAAGRAAGPSSWSRCAPSVRRAR